jgi:hypothetical protein
VSGFENPLQWKQGDTLPTHRVKLTERDPTVDPTAANPTPRRGIDLTNATSITLVATTRNRRRTVSVACVKDPDQTSSVDPDYGRGWLSVTPSVELTANAAVMEGEFLIVWSGGGQQRVPNIGSVDVIVSEAFS